MTPSNDVLYFSDVGQWLEYDGRVKAYDVTNGELLWQSSELGSFWSPVVIASGHVLTPMASPESTSLVVWQSTVPVEDNVAEPILDPPAGIYTNQVNITISTATEDGTIYYTLDGTVPHPGLPGTHHYLHPFTLFESATVSARAHKEGYLPSDVASADYVVTKPMVAKPVLVPGGGEFEGQVNITMSTATEGALIYYTLDGTTPDPSNATTRHYLIPSRSSRAPESRPGP